MRKIKFRGKQPDNGEWIYGYYIGDCGDGMHEICTETDGIMLDVDPETVGELTGLLDKNGKEIYEGDVIKMTWYNSYGTQKECIGEVKYDQTDCRFIIGARKWLRAYGSHLEVIGNIHDNQELLEGVNQ